MLNLSPKPVAAGSSGLRREVEEIIASGIFPSPSKQADLLMYLLDKTESGHAHELKEYIVAVELFGKPPDFDSNQDATVRVQAHRLLRDPRTNQRGQGGAAIRTVPVAVPCA